MQDINASCFLLNSVAQNQIGEKKYRRSAGDDADADGNFDWPVEARDNDRRHRHPARLSQKSINGAHASER